MKGNVRFFYEKLVYYAIDRQLPRNYDTKCCVCFFLFFFSFFYEREITKIVMFNMKFLSQT